MVLLHTLRSARFILKGMWDRAAAVKAYEKHCAATGVAPRRSAVTNDLILPLTMETKTRVYMGWRMVDAFGHINNARYLEAFEFGRWHSMAVMNLHRRMLRIKLYPVMVSADVQYLREIKGGTTVVCRTRIYGTAGPKMGVYTHQLESVDGKTIYATSIIRASWLNFPSYRLPDGSKPPRGSLLMSEVLQRIEASPEEQKQDYNEKGGAFATTADGLTHTGPVPIGTNERYFGPPQSKYDKLLSSDSATNATSPTAAQQAFAMERTFPPAAVAANHATCAAVRAAQAEAQAARKAYFAQRK